MSDLEAIGWVVIGAVVLVALISIVRVALVDRRTRRVRFGFFWEREREPPTDELEYDDDDEMTAS